jgi:hypothetical protein
LLCPQVLNYYEHFILFLFYVFLEQERDMYKMQAFASGMDMKS